MARPTEEANEIIEKIENVFEVYGKRINPAAIKIWMEQLERFSKHEILKAFDDHVAGKTIDKNSNHSNYAPKPVHIVQHIQGYRDRKKSFQKKRDEENLKECDPKIEKAWVIFISEILGSPIAKSLERTKNNIVLSRDEVLQIVNREAVKYNNPDAIPDEYKIPEVWENYGGAEHYAGF